MKKKLKAIKGFTLTEMLATVLIMSFVVGSSVTGIVAISSNYRKVIRQTNAEHLCTAINTAMTGELSYAKFIETASGSTTVDSFYSATYRTCNYGLNSNGRLVMNATYNGTATELNVINDSAYPDGLYISNLTIDYDESNNLFTVNVKVGDGLSTEITDTSFVVKDLNS